MHFLASLWWSGDWSLESDAEFLWKKKGPSKMYFSSKKQNNGNIIFSPWYPGWVASQILFFILFFLCKLAHTASHPMQAEKVSKTKLVHLSNLVCYVN